MKKSQKYRKQKTAKQSQSFIIGVGLILVGVALFAILRGPGSSTDETEALADPSVVPMAVDFPAPPLELTNLDGETQSLADFSGKVLLVNNWATWCPPCKAEMPTLKKYHDTHSAEGFSIIAVEAGDEKEEVVQFAEALGLTFPVWLDPDGASINAFKNGSLPNSYVIDREGKVRYAWTGEISLAMLEKFVTPVILEGN